MQKFLLLPFLCFLFCTKAEAIIFVNQNAVGSAGTGDSWANAYTDLQQALAVCQAGDSIWVAAGKYLPSATGDRDASFALVDGVKIFGGFFGVETDIAQRNIAMNPTTLSGDIGIPGIATDNSLHIVTAVGLSAATELDGFIISEGYALGTGWIYQNGAGILLAGVTGLQNSKPKFANCRIENNQAHNGAAVYSEAAPPTPPLTTGGLINPTFYQCTFADNKAINAGGALYLDSATGTGDSLVIEHCDFKDNTAIFWFGGGIYIKETTGSSFVFRCCAFERDSSPYGGAGGAVFFDLTDGSTENVHMSFDSCHFLENLAAEGAGITGYFFTQVIPVKVQLLSLSVNHCIFEKNKSENASGAGLLWDLWGVDSFLVNINTCQFIENKANVHINVLTGSEMIYKDIRISRCLFSGNSGVYSPDNINFVLSCGTNNYITPLTSRTKITECVFKNNGGGIFCGSAPNNYIDTEITNCTFYNNQSYVITKSFDTLALDPAGYHNEMAINNCIFWEPYSDYQRLFYNNDPNDINMHGFHFDHSSINFPKEVFIQEGGFDSFGPHTIFEAYPEFVNTLLGDLRLKSCSPMQDVGKDSIALASGLDVDFDDNPRYRFGSVDLGAYEIQDSCSDIQIHHYFVNLNVIGGLENGTSWENAFKQVQEALVKAKYGDTIWVAQGTYYPTTGTDRSKYFKIADGIKLFGGFNGSETDIAQRMPQEQPTILSGDIGIPGTIADNSYGVVYGKGLSEATVIDGFFIKDGYGNGNGAAGGGMLLEALPYGPTSRPILSNCVFENNTAIFGGGLSIKTNTGPPPGNLPQFVIPQFNQCSFIQNRALSSGGGIFWGYPAPTADTVVIQDCLFSQNLASSNGSGVSLASIVNGVFLFKNCRFERAQQGFSSAGKGGGVYISSSSPINDHWRGSVLFDSCQFVGNRGSDGSAIYYPGLQQDNNEFNLYLNHCVVDSNLIVFGKGAAITVLGNGNENQHVYISETSISDNQTGSGVIDFQSNTKDTSTLTLERCVILRNKSFGPESNLLNIGTQPGSLDSRKHLRVTNSLFAGNEGGISTRSGANDYMRSEFANCTFYQNGPRLFRKSWDASFSPGSPYTNETFIANSLIWEPQVVADSLFTNWEAGAINSMSGYQIAYSSVPHAAQAFTQVGAAQALVSGNLFEQIPLFADTQAYDFRLLPCAPQVNGGSNLIADTFLLDYDLGGGARILHGLVDMGAYETPDTCTIILTAEPGGEPITISLFPNPVSAGGYLNLTMAGATAPIERVIIYNALGQQMATFAGSSEPIQIIAPAVPGSYSAVLVHGGRISAVKFEVLRRE